MTSRLTLKLDWCSSEEAPGVDCLLPGIYRWTIEGGGVYIGKYKNISRPRKEYQRNVERLLNGEPYRKSKPDQYRKVHRALADAVREGRKITLTILENPPSRELNRREHELITLFGSLHGERSSTGTFITQ